MSAMKPTAAPVRGTDSGPVTTSSEAPDLAVSNPDKFHGQGGSYVRDPVTGQRELVERTLPCDCGSSAAH